MYSIDKNKISEYFLLLICCRQFIPTLQRDYPFFCLHSSKTVLSCISKGFHCYILWCMSQLYFPVNTGYLQDRQTGIFSIKRHFWFHNLQDTQYPILARHLILTLVDNENSSVHIGIEIQATGSCQCADLTPRDLLSIRRPSVSYVNRCSY